jgi:hypothetical protein
MYRNKQNNSKKNKNNTAKTKKHALEYIMDIKADSKEETSGWSSIDEDLYGEKCDSF